MSLKGSFKFDASRFQAAARKLAGLPKSPAVQVTMKRAAGQVVRMVIDVTPPATGKANSSAKKRGELAILGDLAKLMVGATKRREKEGGLPDPAEVHAQARDSRTGRVMMRGRSAGGQFSSLEGKVAVGRADLARYRREMVKLVGELAAGWNAAAKALGVKVPAWIARHGDRYGVIKVELREHGMRITIGNDVPFVDNITELSRRLQWALDTVAKSIVERQIPAIVKRLGRAAGFK